MRAFQTAMRTMTSVTMGLAMATALGQAGGAEAKGQEEAGLLLDLVEQTTDANLEYRLAVGAVLDAEAKERDAAICLVPIAPPMKGGQGYTDEAPVLVAYLVGGDKGLAGMITPDGAHEARDEATVEIRVADHHASITPYAKGLDCEDSHGILKRLGRQELILGNLEMLTELDLGLEVTNVIDDGRMVMEVVGGDVAEECHIPSDHQHVRYGQGWMRDVFHPDRYEDMDSLYVCSAGERVCTFPGSFMDDADNEVVIVANDLDNTVMLSAPGYPGGAQLCDGPELDIYPPHERYAIDGWPADWEATVALYGGEGHDWMVDGPNDDFMDGGPGNDMLVGGAGNNMIYGRDGRDVMHGGNDEGFCDGGSPSDDNNCYLEGNWPYEGDFAGDCCCHSCFRRDGCYYSDMTPGISDVPPTPW